VQLFYYPQTPAGTNIQGLYKGPVRRN
jgi:hypothetical protein